MSKPAPRLKAPATAPRTVAARAKRATPPAPASASEDLDLETRVRADHHASVRLWLRLLSCTNLVAAELRRRLREEFDCTLPRFDLMSQLERAPDGLSMSEVSKRMMVTNAAITGLTDRLVADGHVERVDDASDRRTFRIRLTPEGRAYFLRMARKHEGWVVEMFAGLDARKKTTLRDLAGELKRNLRKG